MGYELSFPFKVRFLMIRCGRRILIVVDHFREYLTSQRFTEIITSKIVASGTEGGTNLFELKYFDRVAYLAQSPQFYKEHGVAGFERVYETGHVYRAEPHASSRHLTEYYSLDFEVGFIDGPEDVIQIERELLTYIFERLNKEYGHILERHREHPLPSMLEVPIWEFGRCLELLKENFGRTDLTDDLDPEGERQLCALVENETGVAAVFVIGYPLASRPFYTAPREIEGTPGAAHSFDLLFQGVEITTGGQRLHRREDLEAALRGRGIDPAGFESHLKMFELGMPPWWKILRSLALKGRRFDTWAEVEQAIAAATTYWQESTSPSVPLGATSQTSTPAAIGHRQVTKSRHRLGGAHLAGHHHF